MHYMYMYMVPGVGNDSCEGFVYSEKGSVKEDIYMLFEYATYNDRLFVSEITSKEKAVMWC